MTEEEIAAVRDALEKLVDASSLWRVIAVLGEVAELKAQHIEENWQDATTVKAWRKAAVALDKLYTKTEV